MTEQKYKIGIIGLGVVGGALRNYFIDQGYQSGKDLFGYDLYKESDSLEQVNTADLFFVGVPTPYTEGVGCDLTEIKKAVSDITGQKIVVIRSTIIPGTTDQLQKDNSQHRFLFVPEFLTEKNAQKDLRSPDRQIVGYTKESKDIAKDILDILPKAPYSKTMTATEAETVKYCTNAFLATKVSFANHIYDFCKSLGLDYENIKEGVRADKRIGNSHWDVPCGGQRGYGGKCLPKDVKAFIAKAKSQQVDFCVIETADKFNDKVREEK